MNNLRIYGSPPYRIAVIHGGPGASGEMAPVAQTLAFSKGILEPLQTATSLQGQVEELKDTLETNGTCPVILVGYSWGAWLSFLVAAHHPTLVSKLILVSSGPFEEQYVNQLRQNRFDRLTEEERETFETTVQKLSDKATQNKDELLSTLGTLANKTAQYDPLPDDGTNLVDGQGDIFQNVWNDASQLRKTGQLIGFAKQIQCPVVAIHGDYDPHPAGGVQEPLSEHLQDFQFRILENCGHTPWRERQAKDQFYKILNDELQIS